MISSDEDEIVPGGSVVPPPGGGGEDADIDCLVDAIQARDNDGKFFREKRRIRRREVTTFAIIEPVDEPESGSSDADGESAAQASRTWQIRGPVRGYSDDGWRLSTVTIVRAHETMACAEVYVRSMRLLVPGTYVDAADAYTSVKFVAAAQAAAGLSWDTASPTSSFRGLVHGQELDDDDVAMVLQQAYDSSGSAPQELSQGHVELVRRSPARRDRVHVRALQCLLRQRSRNAVADYRQKGHDVMKPRWRKLLRGVGAGVVAMMRRILEFDDNHEPGTSARAQRTRVSRGFTQMHLLPTAAQLRAERRRDFDRPDRIAHFFFTRQGHDKLVRWDYIRGSGSAGIRRYRSGQGDEKRLRGYNNRYWEDATPGAEGDCASDGEDDGVYYNNANAETEGCYAPVETDAERLKELLAHSTSYLENEDETGELQILAIAFDAPAALQRGIDLATVPGVGGADQAANVPAVVTFAADGGVVRNQNITAFVAAVAWPQLSEGRTDLVPLAYSFSNEKRVDKLVAKAVRDMLQDVMSTTFTALVDIAAEGGAEEEEERIPELQRVSLQLFPEVQVCGTFDWVSM